MGAAASAVTLMFTAATHSASAQQQPQQPPAPPTAAQPQPGQAPPAASSPFPSFNSVRMSPGGVAVVAPQGGAAPGGPPGAFGTPVPPVAVTPPQAAPAPAAAPKAAVGPARAAAPAKPKSDTVKTAISRTNDSALSKAAETKGVSIAVLVNDDPITGYEIDQRQRFMALSSNIGERAQANFKRSLQDPSVSERLKGILGEIIKANPGKTKEQILAIFEERKKQFAQGLQKQAVESARASVLPGLRKQALDELIEERLKVGEAKKLNVLASDEDVSRIVKSIAEKNKMTEAQFAQHLAGLGTDIDAMRSRFRATLSWNEVIKRKYGHQIAISERDVERVVAQGPTADDSVELQVQRIVLPIAGKLAQKAVDQRVGEAEALRAKFKDCKSMVTLATGVTGAKFEDLGTRKAGTIGEPTRSFLVNAKDGEMVPPTVGTSGVELYAVCGRQVAKADEQKRTAAMEELRQKEFELFAKRHLRILRDDASITFR
ncbi:MAG: SurA N-terminal domain-containing protein [Hyphomicrobiaceae bacterium]|nr:SurA N-terminal domain-containing protein [Hyphomicrobiaceae bacterium]